MIEICGVSNQEGKHVDYHIKTAVIFVGIAIKRHKKREATGKLKTVYRVGN